MVWTFPNLVPNSKTSLSRSPCDETNLLTVVKSGSPKPKLEPMKLEACVVQTSLGVV